MRALVITLIAILILAFGMRIDTITNEIPYPINIRARPSGDADKLGQFEQDDVYEVIKLLGDWVEIRFGDKPAYSYRKELIVNRIVIRPIGISFKVKLEYSEVHVGLFSDTLNGAGRIDKTLPRIVLLVVLLLVLFSGKRKKQITTRSPVKVVSGTPTVKNTKLSYQKSYEDQQTSFDKGNLFEAYIADKFSNQYYRLLDWTSDKTSTSGKWAASNLNPDLKFLELASKKEFYVECKYRRDDEIYIEERQLRRYRAIAARTKIPVFLAVGTGGKPNRPKYLYIIPIYKTKGVSDLNTIKMDYKKKDIAKGLYYDPKSKRLL